MSRLPPAEKLPLALRKNVRDEWENNKEDLEKELSEHLGAEWTIDINPLAIWPYHGDGYAKESLGNCIKGYVEGAIYHLKGMVSKHGDEFKNEINSICSERVLTLDLEEASPPRFSYCGCDVLDGRLRMLFVEGNLGINVNDCCAESVLTKALNAAPSDAPYSYVVRRAIATDYDAAIGEVRADIAGLLGKDADDITLNPNFEANFAKMSAAGDVSSDDWQQALPKHTLRYFDALAYQMKTQKVGEDEMIREALLEAIESSEIAFRVVDELKHGSYCEAEFDGGVLYLQTTPANFGININDVANKLVDLL